MTKTLIAPIDKRSERRRRAKEFAKLRGLAVCIVADEIWIDFPLSGDRAEFVCDVVNALRPTDVRIENDEYGGALQLAWD